jgi:hypothetical protein
MLNSLKLLLIIFFQLETEFQSQRGPHFSKDIENQSFKFVPYPSGIHSLPDFLNIIITSCYPLCELSLGNSLVKLLASILKHIKLPLASKTTMII